MSVLNNENFSWNCEQFWDRLLNGLDVIAMLCACKLVKEVVGQYKLNIMAHLSFTITVRTLMES